MNYKALLGIFFVGILVNAEKVSYEGYRLYKVIPKTEEQVIIVQDIKDSGLGEFWEDHIGVNDDVRIMVPGDKEEDFVDTVKLAGMEIKLIIENVQKAIDDQLKSAAQNKDSSSFHSLDWDSYHTVEEIYAWLDELVEAYPDIVSTVVIGNSFENRPIKGIIINYQPHLTYPNVGIIESTIHAREWITPATVTWIIKEFLTSSDQEIRDLAENFEWHIFPVVNPDGYAYTFSTHRMWRKNRNTSYFTSCNASGTHDDMSNGVDLNRNFDFAWNTVGTSPDPCSNTYPGPLANSEPETIAIVQYILSLNEKASLVYYLAIHSYSQLIITPYSHISGFEAAVATNYADMYEIGIRSADRMKQRFGTEYRVGLSSDVMYPMSGTSFDWVKFTTHVPVSYLFELRDLGDYGFLLPPSQIIPVGLETMDFLVEMNKHTRAMGLYNLPPSAASSVSSICAVVIGIALMMIIN